MKPIAVLIPFIAFITGTAQAQAHAGWRMTPTIVVIGTPGDPRLDLVDEAVTYWNNALTELGSNFRLPMPQRVVQPIPEEALQAMSAAVLKDSRSVEAPQAVRGLPGNLTILLADSAFVSFAGPFIAPGKRIVGIRNTIQPPLNFSNVARNLIAHELGHSIGMGHNADPTMLMCGRPAPCRPDGYRSDMARMFPLSEDDKQQLLRTYPPDWKARSR